MKVEAQYKTTMSDSWWLIPRVVSVAVIKNHFPERKTYTLSLMFFRKLQLVLTIGIFNEK